MPGDLTAVAPSVSAVLTVSGPSPADLTDKCELRFTLLSVCLQAVFPKSDEQRARLSDAVQGILLFRALDPVSGKSAGRHGASSKRNCLSALSDKAKHFCL